MPNCEHGLTSKECLTCASPKHGDAQQTRKWVPLTEEEIWSCNRADTDEEFCHLCVDHQNVPDFARAIEAKLKEKNT